MKSQHAALIAAIMAAVTFAVMFLFDLPWLAAAVIVLAGIAGILLSLSNRREPPSK
jgi:hypothetical protein